MLLYQEKMCDACLHLPLQKKGPVHEAWANRGNQTKYINIAQDEVHTYIHPLIQSK